jgi:hypothetical protein
MRRIWNLIRKNKFITLCIILILVYYYFGFYDYIFDYFWPKPYQPNVVVIPGAAPVTPQ